MQRIFLPFIQAFSPSLLPFSSHYYSHHKNETTLQTLFKYVFIAYMHLTCFSYVFSRPFHCLLTCPVSIQEVFYYMEFRLFDIVPQVTESLSLLFSNLFLNFLCFHWDSFCCYVFRFSDLQMFNII